MKSETITAVDLFCRAGGTSTGLIQAVRYLKDSRLLPEGFDKATAHSDVAVYGTARDDPDFTAGVSMRKVGDTAVDVYAVTTTQEEVGLRGARTASYRVKPDIGIGIDVTLSCDTPGVPEHERVTVQGEGFGLHLKDSSFISDAGLVRQIEALAKDREIPYQRTILARGGQDNVTVVLARA